MRRHHLLNHRSLSLFGITWHHSLSSPPPFVYNDSQEATTILTEGVSHVIPPRKRNFEKAASLAAAALEIGKESAAAWEAYGAAHDGLGHDAEARQGYTMFIKLTGPEMAAQVEWAQKRMMKLR